jgi:hypothetical protein
MKNLTRVVAVLVAVGFSAPALACSDMQQTTAEKTAAKPAVAKAQKVKKADKAQTTVAKAQVSRPAAN